MPEPRKNLPPSLSRSVASRRDALGGQRLLDQADRPVQRLGQDVGTRSRQQRVGAGEPDEGDARDPVLRVGRARVEVLPQLDAGTACAGSDRGRRPGGTSSCTGRAECGASRRAQQQRAVLARAGRRPGPAAAPVLGADDDLAGLRGLLRQRGRRRARPEDEQLAGRARRRGTGGCRRSGCPTDIDSESRPTDVGTAAACAQRRAASRPPRRTPARRGPSPRNRNSRASPPNFSSSPPRVAGDPQHRAEDPVEGLDDLLGTDPARVATASRSGR